MVPQFCCYLKTAYNYYAPAAKESKQPPEVRKFYMIHSLYMRRKAGFEVIKYKETGKIKEGRLPKLANDLLVNYDALDQYRQMLDLWCLLTKLDDDYFDFLIRTATSLTYNMFYNEAKKLNNPDMPKQQPGEYQRSGATTVASTLEEQGVDKRNASKDYKLLEIQEARRSAYNYYSQNA